MTTMTTRSLTTGELTTGELTTGELTTGGRTTGGRTTGGRTADGRTADGRTTGDGRVRRVELGAFLRSRRERISPEDAGLPPGFRRRTSGLRREEVAQLSGVGVTWYTWLEQGRPINASTQVLDAVARTLKLDQPEREHLYRLADVPDRAPATDAGWRVEPEIQQILDGLTTLPASVMNERFDLLAWNEPYAALFPVLVSQPCATRNALWMCFTHPACCHPYLNRADQLGTLVAQLRGAYGRHVGEPAWTGFVRRLQAASPEFGQFWAQHEVASPASYLKIFRHPAHDRLVMTSNSLAVLAAPGTRIVVYTPVDEPTRAALASLVAGQGRAARYPCWSAHHPPQSAAAPAAF